jgi:hypothetical protein
MKRVILVGRVLGVVREKGNMDSDTEGIPPVKSLGSPMARLLRKLHGA